MYQALYRAFRPEVFDEMLGQEHIVKILKNQIATDSVSHAYLFCGTRGTGKTTTARLLAKGLNCTSDGARPCGHCANCRAIKDGTFIDVQEIDAASNRGVDDIRGLRESVIYPPAVGRKKVYIIDEVHMLTAEASNALLKTLEEPPDYVTFILATTEVQKLPQTILSRCMRLDFRRVPENTLMKGMADICDKIDIEVSEDALRIIASNADGSVRDALSILDQCISGGDKVIGSEDVLEFLGASGDEDFIELTEFIRKKQTAAAISLVSDILSDGKDVRQFMRDWINHYRNLLMTKFIDNPEGIVNMSTENIDRIRRQSSVMDLEDIKAGILELSKAINEAGKSAQPRIFLELAVINLSMSAEGNGAIETYKREANPVAGIPRKASRHERGSDEHARGSEAIDAAEKPELSPELSEDKNLTKGEYQAEVSDTDEVPDSSVAAASPVKMKKSEEASPDEITDFADAAQDEIAEPADEASYEITKPDGKHHSTDEGEADKADETDKAGEGVNYEYDLDAVWNDVIVAGEKKSGSFHLLALRGRLTHIGETDFDVSVSSDFDEKYIEKNRDQLEKLMAQCTGSHRSMRIVNDEEASADKPIDEIAAEAGKILGVKVEIE